MEKISMNDIRKKNYSGVYRLLYQKRRISKSKIASSLEMSLPTVTQHLSTLEAEGLIERQGQMASGIGRKAAAYAPVASTRIAVGVEVLPCRASVVASPGIDGRCVSVPGRASGRRDYFRREDLDKLFSAIQERTAFPERENFLRLGAREENMIATGEAIPFVRLALSSI